MELNDAKQTLIRRPLHDAPRARSLYHGREKMASVMSILSRDITGLSNRRRTGPSMTRRILRDRGERRDERSPMRQKNLEKSAVIDYLRTTVRLTRRVSVHRFATRRRCDRRSVAAATTKDDETPSAISGSPLPRTLGGLIETPTAERACERPRARDAGRQSQVL